MLACLALWLPARGANAALGPVDAVVMIAGGGAQSAADIRGAAPVRRGDARTRGTRDGTARQGTSLSAPAVDTTFFEQAACRADRAGTANPTFVERQYLHCCVFLR